MDLFDMNTLLAYLPATTVLVLIPGPGTAWIVAQAAFGASRGVRAAFGLETARLTACSSGPTTALTSRSVH